MLTMDSRQWQSNRSPNSKIAAPAKQSRFAPTAVRLLASAAVALAVLAATASPASAEQWTKKYTVSGRPSVHVATDDGNISIIPGPAGEIQADVDADGYRIPSDVRISESQAGDGVRLDVKVPGTHFHLFGGVHNSLKITVHVPSDSDLDIQSGDGNVTAQAVNGNIRVSTGDGNIVATGLKGVLRNAHRRRQHPSRRPRWHAGRGYGDGKVTVRGRFDSLNLKSGDGSIDADATAGSKIPAGGRLDAAHRRRRVNLRLPRISPPTSRCTPETPHQPGFPGDRSRIAERLLDKRQNERRRRPANRNLRRGSIRIEKL